MEHKLEERLKGVIKASYIAQPVQHAVALSVHNDRQVVSLDVKTEEFIIAIWGFKQIVSPRA